MSSKKKRNNATKQHEQQKEQDIFVLRAHPVRGESHNQSNTTGEVATV